MGSGIAGIDHVIVGVRDLERARLDWSRLGFTLSPRGRHVGQGTANYCIMFPSDYVELLGIADPNDFVRQLDSFLAHREGLMAVALATAVAPEELRTALLRRQLQPSEPRPLARQLQLPEGASTLRFCLLSLPPHETPGLDCFICSHLTPELMRRPEWLTHPNGAQGLIGIHVLVESTTALLEPYDRIFGIPQVTTTDAVTCIEVGRHRIVFSTPDDFSAMHPGLELDVDFPLPGIVAFEVAVQSREQTADYLSRGGVPFDEVPAGGLVVGVNEANGTFLFFSESEPLGRGFQRPR
jgi:hypothetical protein